MSTKSTTTMGTHLRRSILALFVCVTVALGGCASNPSNQSVGSAVGGILGGVGMVLIAPGHAAAAILGTLAGASIGGNIGRTMDEADRIKLGQVLERSPSYRTSGWKNPVTGYRYRVTPRQAYGYSAQTYCREYKLKSQVGGRQQEVNGRACRLPNGSWRVQS